VKTLGYTLTGKVVFPDGSSGPNILVMATQVEEDGVSRKQARVLAAGPDSRREFVNTLQTVKNGETGVYATTTDAEGVYLLNGLETGSYFIEASRGSMKATSRATVSPYEAAVVDLALTPTGGIAGYCTLQGADSGGYAGTFVVIKGTDYIGFTDDDGSYTLSQIPVGGYQVSFVHPGYESVYYPSTVTIPTADLAVLDSMSLTPLAGGTVTGTVTAQDQEPLEGVMVVIEHSGGGQYFTVTDDLGEYRVDGVNPGTVDVVFNHDLIEDGYVREHVGVVEGETVPVNAVLTDERTPVWESTSGVVYVTEIDPLNGGLNPAEITTVTAAVEFGRCLDASTPLTFVVYHNTVESWDADNWENNHYSEVAEANLYDGIRAEQGAVIEGLESGIRYIFGVRVKDRHGNMEYNRGEYLFVAGDDSPTAEERDNLLTAVGNIGIGTKDPQGLLHVEAESGSAFVVNAETGNVGIGTTDPHAALTVGGGAQQATPASESGTFAVNDTGTVISGVWQGEPIADDYIESVSGSKVVGDIPASQIVGDIPSSQITGDIAASQISGDIPGSQVTGDIGGNAVGVTGIIPVEKGGTGAATAEQARTNLGIDSLTATVSGGPGGSIEDGTITNDDVSASAAIDFSKINVIKTDITGLGIPGEDTDTVYAAGFGITLENTTFSLDPQDASTGQILKWTGTAWEPSDDSNTHLSDSDIGNMGYIKTDTKLSDSDIATMGYIKTAGETDPTVDLDKLKSLVQNDFHALGGTDADTQLSDSDIANLGYIKTAGETDPTVDLTKLQTLVQNDFHNLGGTDADTTYSAGDGLNLDGTTFSLDQQGATNDQVLKWNGRLWAPGTDSNTTYTAGANITFDGTTIDAAADGHSLDAADGSPADVVFVNADGNVGIGVPSAGASLEVTGPVLVTATGVTFEVNEAVKAEASGSTTTHAVLAAGTGTGTTGSSTQGVFGKAYYNGDSTATDFTLMPLASGIFGRAATGTYDNPNSSIAANAVGVSGSATTAQLGSNTGVIGTARDGAHRNIGLLSLTNLTDLEIIAAYTALPAGFTAGLYSDNKLEGTNDYVIFAAGGADGSGGKSYFAGSVGIGTVAPTEKLHVAGGLAVGFTTGTTAGTIRFNAGTFEGYTGTEWKDLDVQAAGSAWTEETGFIRFEGDVGLGTTDPGSDFAVSGAAAIGAGYYQTAAPSNGLLVEGRVGIGTTDPIYTLHSTRNIGITGNDPKLYIVANEANDDSAVVVLENTAQNASTFIGLAGRSGATLSSAVGGDFIINNRSGQKIILSADTGYAEQHLVIMENGNVGIGTTEPAEKLEVNGTAKFLSLTGQTIESTAVGFKFPDGTIQASAGATALDGLSDAKTDTNSIFIGTGSGAADDGDNFNIAIGMDALSSNDSGYRNIAIGYWALKNTTTDGFPSFGGRNTGVGYYALQANTRGVENTALGHLALANNTGGYRNTVIGHSALSANIAGKSNVVIGAQAADSITGGEECIFIGADVEAQGNGDINSIVIGAFAMGLGSNTVVLGNNGITTTALWGNVGIGTTAPAEKLDVNGAVKVLSLVGQTIESTAVGFKFPNGTIQSTAGATALDGLSDAISDGSSIFLGSGSGANDDGSDNMNVAVGIEALPANTSGYSNTAFGSAALRENSTSCYNTALGCGALVLTTGGNNTGCGAGALRYNRGGSSNVALGHSAGSLDTDATTGLDSPTNGIYIGANVKGKMDNETNAIVIGYNAVGLGSNTVLLGNDSITTTALKGNVGIGTTAPTTKLHVYRANQAPGIASQGDGWTGVNGGWVDPIIFWNSNGSLRLGTTTACNDDATDWAEKMRITNAGNVGIGTTAPAEKLEVNGAAKVLSLTGQTIESTAVGFKFPDGTIQSTAGASALDGLSDVKTDTGSIFLGSGTGVNTTGGGSNVAIGIEAMNANTTGNYSTAIGKQSLYSITGGGHNTASGFRSLYSLTNGLYNIAVGMYSLQQITTGSGNVAIGYQAGELQADGTTNLTETQNSIYIGHDVKGKDNNDSNSIVIGYDAVGLGANTVVLGNDSITTTALKGKVGIGTTTPITNLEIKGSAYPAVRVTSTDTEGGGVELWSSGGYYHVYVENDDLGFWNGDDFNKMTLTGEGNLVIGTTLPNEILTVEGPVSLMGITTEPTATTDYGKLFVKNTDDKLYFVDSGGTSHSLLDTVKIGTGDSDVEVTDTGSDGTITFTTDNAESMRINNTGKVGIGTTVPEAMLHIEGGKFLSEYTNGQLTAATIDDVTSDFGAHGLAENNAGDLYMRSYWGVNIDRHGGNMDHSNYTNGSNPDGGSLAVRYRTDATTFRTDLIIDKDGLVGIGTTDPGSLLHVNSDSGNAYAVVDSAANVEAGLQLHENGVMKWQLQNAGNDGDKFYVCADGGNSDRFLTITQDGKVGVGTTIPSTTLDVQGGAQFGSGNVNLVDATGKIPEISSTYFASLSGQNLTSLNASNISTGTIGISKMPTGGTWNLTSNLSIDSFMYIDQANKKVGIGTTAPENTVHIVDNNAGDVLKVQGSGAHTRIVVESTTAHDAILRMTTTNADFGWYADGGSNTCNLYNFGTSDNSISVDSTDQVGIGTYIPTAKLHVKGGDIRLEADQQLDFGDTYRKLSYLTATGHMSLQSPGPVSMVIDNNGNGATDYFSVMKDSTDPAAATELFRVQDDGNVGIGSTAPNEMLDIDLGAGSVTGGIRVGNNDGSGSAYSSYVDNGETIWYTGVDGSDSKFKIRNSGTTWASGTDRLEIDAGTGLILLKGDVGVGTTAPSSKFSVSGNAAIGSGYYETAAPTDGLIVEGNVGIGTTDPTAPLDVYDGWIQSRDATAILSLRGKQTGTMYGFTDFSAVVAHGDTQPLVMGTHSSSDVALMTNSTQRIRITNAGNVGIGSTSPGAKLDVNGAIKGTTVNTGQGDNELYAMNQNVRTSDSVTFAGVTASAVNTGVGDNELYAMNQNVRTTDSVTFAGVATGGTVSTANLTASSTITHGDWIFKSARGKLQTTGSSYDVNLFTLGTDYHHAHVDVTVSFQSYTGSYYHHGSFSYWVKKGTGTPAITTLATHYNSDSGNGLAIDGLYASGNDIHFKITNNSTSSTNYTISFKYTVLDPW